MSTLLGIYIVVGVLSAIAYGWLILFYLRGWRDLPKFNLAVGDRLPDTKVTIIVAARNEAGNIQACLDSLLAQAYPHEWLQIIIVDDHSTDSTADLIQATAGVEYVLSEGTGKKAALATGIARATGSLILTTDADCIVPPGWVAYMLAYYQQTDHQFIAAPALFRAGDSWLTRFQALDFTGMMMLTGAGLHRNFQRMANGANCAFTREAYEQVGGYTSSSQYASGDDMFLLHSIATAYPGRVGFLKQAAATVFTDPAPTLSAFYRQRLRWATKNAAFSDWRVNAALLPVGVLSVAIVAGVLLSPLSWHWLAMALGLLAGKSGFDFLLLRESTTFFGRRGWMRFFPLSALLHPLYIAVVGVASQFVKRYEWKGREVV